MRSLDNILKDCFKFFLQASKLFGFERHFRKKLNIKDRNPALKNPFLGNIKT